MLRVIESGDILFSDNSYDSLPENPKTGLKKVLSGAHGISEIVDVVLGKYYLIRTLYDPLKERVIALYVRDEVFLWVYAFSISYGDVGLSGSAAWLKMQNEALKKIIELESQEVKTVVTLPSRATE
jgi:hypothetical protein